MKLFNSFRISTVPTTSYNDFRASIFWILYPHLYLYYNPRPHYISCYEVVVSFNLLINKFNFCLNNEWHPYTKWRIDLELL